ncbi:MAG: preprotein translocase subunit YajC [Aminobacterium colombiense]|jgi:preprotein translocase subunit YajC|nr:MULTISPECIES: preprotein translocase subunit YajC [Aminobacterium]MDD2379043.1 preprotein translocase subunit YajC [Aminobacterium colombiense]MDD3767304.1 preprotein translocase subunit YajC [Aminobacterium colombiense]MDD4265333.1 preprotein translocase subunit YajC [Aminobacterium colombiense]MDD4586043.1 preprotein translocase subunit YajC [Aminobacterium colombiense]
MLFPLVIFVLIFYFFIIRPQKKRQKQHDDLLAALTRGDQVITAGGFFGIIREVKDDSIILEIADGVKVRILKSSIVNKRSSVAEQGKEKVTEEPKEVSEEHKIEEKTTEENEKK